MNTERMREEFEAAYLGGVVGPTSTPSEQWLERGSDGEYRSFRANGAWWGWQASRAALVIELPRGESLARRMYGPQESGINPLISLSDAVVAIESLGLKVRP